LARNVTEPEIDALLASPAEPRPAVVSRDFREPRRYSASDLETLRRQGEIAAAAVLESLRAVVPIEIVPEAIEVAEASLDVATRGDGTEIVGALCDGATGPSVALLEALSAVAIAELALGADENESTESRPLTPLESKLVERLLVRVLERAAQSLQIPGKDPRFFASRTALSRELGTDGDRRRIAIRIPFSIGPARAVIHLLMAGVKLPPPAKSAAPAKDARKTSLPAEIAPTNVEISAVLARTDILLTELLALEPGDVIPLDIGPGQPIALEIEGEPRARAKFGARDGRLAVRIQEILRTPAPR